MVYNFGGECAKCVIMGLCFLLPKQSRLICIVIIGNWNVCVTLMCNAGEVSYLWNSSLAVLG